MKTQRATIKRGDMLRARTESGETVTIELIGMSRPARLKITSPNGIDRTESTCTKAANRK